jgi:hypothetical protein
MSDETPEKKPAAKKPAAPKKPAAKTPAAPKAPAAKKPAATQPKRVPAKAAVEPDARVPESPVAAAAAAAGTAATKPITPVVAKPKKTPAKQTQPTEVIPPADAPAAEVPATASAAPAETTTAEPQVVVVDAPARKRRRWPFVVGGIVLLLVILLVVGYFVGESYARSKAIETIKAKVVAVLGVQDPSTVKVDIGSGPVLFQALAGKLNEVNVTADEVVFGELSGAATLHAEDVPLDANAKTKSLDITFALPEDQVASQLTAALGDIKPDSVALEEPEITVDTTIDLFFFKLPVGVGLEPSAEDGQLVFTPTTVKLGDQDYTPAELRDELGNLAEPFLAANTLCVSDALPVALTVTDVDVVGKELVLKIEGDQVALGGPDMSTKGSCDG